MIKLYPNYHLAYIVPENVTAESGVVLGFSTKHGGVSQGRLTNMNMSFSRGDAPEHVTENYKRFAEALGVAEKGIYSNHQVHGNQVRVVDVNDEKTGFFAELEYDAAVTDREDVILTAVHADCIPVFFYDPVRCVIGAAHSGWKGTVLEVAAETVKKMTATYGTKPGDVQVWIGPGICKDCFLVRNDVYQQFLTTLPWSKAYMEQVAEDQFTVDMKGIITTSLCHCGVQTENIHDMKLCTSCQEGLFFSHRRDKGNTGAMVGMIALCKQAQV